MRPVDKPADETHQHVEQKRRPELPADGMLAVAEEVTDLEGLFDLLEKDFDAPARLIELANRACRPVRVVSDEDHDNILAVDGHDHFHPAHQDGILLFAFRGPEQDEVVTQDVSLGAAQEFFTDGVSHVVLGARYPEDASQGEVVKVGEVDVGLVKQGNLAFPEVGAKLGGAGVVVMGCLLDDGVAGQEALEVEAQVQLGRCLAAAVFRPGHAVGHQGDGGRVHGVNGPFESSWHPFVANAEAARHQSLKVAERLPEEFLHHVAVACFVSVGERVAGGGNSSPQAAEPA